MLPIPFDIKKKIFFTGAGFTANFEGFLSKDFGLRVFNYLPAQSKIKSLLLADLTKFEDIYTDVFFERPDEFDDKDKEVFSQSITRIYRSLDDIVCQFGWKGHNDYKIFYPNFSRFLAGSFAGSNSGSRGAIFTVNHDLFFERVHGLKSPMFHDFAFSLQHKYQPLERSLFVKLPNKEKLETQIKNYVDTRFKNDGDFFYFKLHGSYGWLTSDDRELMVIAGPKEVQTRHEPLLDWYRECFRYALMRDDVEVLITGYGFGDENINSLIKEAIDTHNIRFCILTPSVHVESQLKQIKRYALESGLDQVFPYTLSQLFPPNQSPSPYLAEVLKIFPSDR